MKKIYLPFFSATTEIKNFEKAPNNSFKGAAYKVDQGGYRFYAILCEESNGTRQPTFLTLLASEEAKDLASMFEPSRSSFPLE